MRPNLSAVEALRGKQYLQIMLLLTAAAAWTNSVKSVLHRPAILLQYRGRANWTRRTEYVQVRTSPAVFPKMSEEGGDGGNLQIEYPSDEDMKVLEERQLGHRMSNVIGVGHRCKHGFAQAFAFDPIDRAPWQGTMNRKSKLESGLFRLSCPLLVKAIDEWEAEGAVKSINKEIIESGEVAEAAAESGGSGGEGGESAGGGETLAALLDAAHAGHAAARHEIIGERLPDLIESAAEDSEEQSRILRLILSSGIAGQTRSKTDIKCVHAQLGDHLCRSSSNGVAKELMRRLEERGVDVDGDDDCCSQCNLAIPEGEARQMWWYEPNKNKWKLRKVLPPARSCAAATLERAGTASSPLRRCRSIFATGLLSMPAVLSAWLEMLVLLLLVLLLLCLWVTRSASRVSHGHQRARKRKSLAKPESPSEPWDADDIDKPDYASG